MLKITRLEIEGLRLINNFNVKDDRGSFTKTFNNIKAKELGINFKIEEIYFSISNKDVIRGMHFQIPPYEHDKLIYIAQGSITDVILDLRKNSRTFGKFISIEMNSLDKALFIPKGCAHGFKSLEENSIVVYNQTSCYSKEHDAGILWDSFGFNWGIENPIISERDKKFIPFEKFSSPF